MTIRLEGILIPHITPFTREEAIDEAALRKLVHFWVEEGCAGLVSCGSNGETPYLTREERNRVFKVVLEEIGGKVTVIAGTGAPSTRETIVLTRDAAELGCDAAIVVTPYYFKPSREELIHHYSRIVEAVDIPIILYNVPKFTSCNLDAYTVHQLVVQYDQIIGVKDSGGSIGQISELIRLTGNKISVLAGSGDLLLPTLTLGGKGGVLGIANVFPRLCASIYESHRAGKNEVARSLQIKLTFLNEVLMRKMNQISSLKEALRLGGLPGGYPRSPSLELSGAEKEDVRKLLGEFPLPSG